MHTGKLARSHSVWADLDALVLEEVRALGGRPEKAPRSPFVSEDAFIATAVDYLRGHDDPMRLIEQLCAELGLNAVEEADMPDEEFGEAPPDDEPFEQAPPETDEAAPAPRPAQEAGSPPDPEPAP